MALSKAYQLENRDNYTPGLLKNRDAALKGLSLELADGQSPCAPAKVPGSSFDIYDSVV